MSIVAEALDHAGSADIHKKIQNLLRWLCTFLPEEFPVVVESTDPRLQQRVILLTYVSSVDNQVVVNVQWSLRMPCGSSTVDWLPWLPHHNRPACPSTATFRSVRVGKRVMQPRKTVVFGTPYMYSGQVHPVEERTPADMKTLYDETAAIFNYPAGTMNMILVNMYANGSHSIGEHSDNEDGFADTEDVCCWIVGDDSVFGNQARVLKFRVSTTGSGKKRRMKEGLHVLCSDALDPLASRHVVSVQIPQGVYAMRDPPNSTTPGFQHKYSHEMPKRHAGLMERIRTSIRKDPAKWPDFPRNVPLTADGASQTAIVQYGWIQDNFGTVGTALQDGHFRTGDHSKPYRNRVKDGQKFTDWLLTRTSFTLRSFSVPPTNQTLPGSRKRRRT